MKLHRGENVMKLERDIVLRLNAFEASALLVKIYDEPSFKEVTEQLVAIKEQIERECGVKKERLPSGLLRITDDSGNVIVRPPYPWEVTKR